MIELPIVWNTEHASQLQELGIEISLDDTTTRLGTFYRIDAIIPYEEQGRKWVELISGAEKFLIPLTYKEVNEKVRAAFNKNS